MQYFTGIKNLDDLKAAYRQLCRQHHPDLGGDQATMQAINAEYSSLLKTGGLDFGESSADIEEDLRAVIEQLTVLAGLFVELCGRWVWVTGETYQHKEQLKAIGCRFSRKKTAWYWRPADEKRKRRSGLPLEVIREKYGSKLFGPKRQKALA